MIKIVSKEFVNNNEAKREYLVKILGIPFFKRVDSTTNIDVVKSLKTKEIKHIKGFKN